MSRKSHNNSRGGSNRPPQSPIAAALNALINAEDWDEAHKVLQAQRSILLSNDAISALRTRIARHPSSLEDPDPEVLLMEEYLELLEDAHKRGISPAWDRFIAEQQRQEAEAEIQDALYNFLDAPTWDATLHTLEEEQEKLLSDIALTLLREELDDARDNEDIDEEEVEELELHLQLLEDARARGVKAAWERFEETLGITPEERVAQGVLWDYLNAETVEDAFEVLENEQKVLLSDIALTLLRQDIEEAHEMEAPEETQQLERHLHLFEDARARGIAAARASFMETSEE